MKGLCDLKRKISVELSIQQLLLLTALCTLRLQFPYASVFTSFVKLIMGDYTTKPEIKMDKAENDLTERDEIYVRYVNYNQKYSKEYNLIELISKTK